MRANFTPTVAGLLMLGLAGILRAEDSASASWQQEDWLRPATDSKTASGESFRSTTGQVGTNPFAVVPSGALWMDSHGAVYVRQLADPLSLSCETSNTSYNGDLSRSQKAGLAFQPSQDFVLRADLHTATNDGLLPASSTMANGAALSAEGHLPNQSILTLGMRSDRSGPEAPSGLQTQNHAFDGQFQQPIGKLPLSAVLKSHIEGTSTGNGPATNLPSLEQSLVWKPLQTTTLQAGLRQQQYQEYPGVDHQLNEALFADWSQKVIDNVTWHSYAELLNSKGLLDQAPAAPISSGANGTAQATNPASTTSVTSSLPLSMDQQTITFSTGPSFQIQKDLSANLEYSNRWDKTPAAGEVGQEQRVSVSVKGTF